MQIHYHTAEKITIFQAFANARIRATSPTLSAKKSNYIDVHIQESAQARFASKLPCGSKVLFRLPLLHHKNGTFRRIISIRRLDCCEKKNALFVASRSDMYIVSLQQTVHSALLRGFEPCSATGSNFA